MINLNFKNDEKITNTKVIDRLYTDFSKTEKASTFLDSIINIFVFDEQTKEVKLNFNAEKRINFLNIAKLIFDERIYILLENSSNNDLKVILNKAVMHNFKLNFKLKTKLETLKSYAVVQNQMIFKAVAKSLILSIINYYYLQILTCDQKVVICTFNEWQELQAKANAEYMSTLKQFFDDGKATNETPKPKKFEKVTE